MDKINTISIDIAKNSFQILGVSDKKKTIIEKKACREEFLKIMNAVPKSATIYMEACGGANHFGRTFQANGHQVKLISPQLVKPYLKGQKNDKNDARAIFSAASDMHMKFVPVKAMEVQDLQTIYGIRKRYVKERVALSNHIRAILFERGIIGAKGSLGLREAIAASYKDKSISALMLNEITKLFEELDNKESKIKEYDKLIKELIKKQPRAKVLTSIPGVGHTVALGIFTAMSTPEQFKSGRHFAAFLGLIPKQNSTGGKERLGGISRRGNTETRALLVQSAHVVMRCSKAKKNEESSFYRMVRELEERKGKKKAAVAIASKIARIAYQCCKSSTVFNESNLINFHIEGAGRKKGTPTL